MIKSNAMAWLAFYKEKNVIFLFMYKCTRVWMFPKYQVVITRTVKLKPETCFCLSSSLISVTEHTVTIWVSINGRFISKHCPCYRSRWSHRYSLFIPFFFFLLTISFYYFITILCLYFNFIIIKFSILFQFHVSCSWWLCILIGGLLYLCL
jgi:hypothetical protein